MSISSKSLKMHSKWSQQTHSRGKAEPRPIKTKPGEPRASKVVPKRAPEPPAWVPRETQDFQTDLQKNPRNCRGPPRTLKEHQRAPKYVKKTA